MNESIFDTIKRKLRHFRAMNSPLTENDTLLRISVQKEVGWTDSHYYQVEEDYRRFLYESSTTDTVGSPSEEVYTLWRSHILFVRDYFNRWAKILGKVIQPPPVIDSAPVREVVHAAPKSYVDALNRKKASRLARASHRAKTPKPKREWVGTESSTTSWSGSDSSMMDWSGFGLGGSWSS